MNWKPNLRKRRAVSEVISTLLILAITMVGAVFVASIVQDSMMGTLEQNMKSESYPNSVRLTAFDTRDSTILSEIPSLNNKFDQILCTKSCQSNPISIPVNNGTEFIIIQIRNVNVDSVFIHKISVDGINHFWDEKTASKLFDASADDATGKYPANGKFSIIPMSNENPLIQSESIEVSGGKEIRVIIKLSEDFNDDIEMWRPLPIFLDYGGPELANYIILSGDMR